MHFAGIDTDSDGRSSKEIEPPSATQLGMNVAAQQSRGEINFDQTDEEIGVDTRSMKGRSIEDMAGIILVSCHLLS